MEQVETGLEQLTFENYGWKILGWGGTNYSGTKLVQSGNQVLQKQSNIGFLQLLLVQLQFIKAIRLKNGTEMLITSLKDQS